MACWHGRWAGSLDTSVLLGTCGSRKHKVGMSSEERSGQGRRDGMSELGAQPMDGPGTRKGAMGQLSVLEESEQKLTPPVNKLCISSNIARSKSDSCSMDRQFCHPARLSTSFLAYPSRDIHLYKAHSLSGPSAKTAPIGPHCAQPHAIATRDKLEMRDQH